MKSPGRPKLSGLPVEEADQRWTHGLFWHRILKTMEMTQAWRSLHFRRNVHGFCFQSFGNFFSSFLLLIVINAIQTVSAYPAHPTEADHITAMSGDFVVFNCEVNFPNDQAVPYVVQWWRKDRELPIYIWYDDYPTHSAKEYAGRVSRAEIRSNSTYGLASLNLTNIRNEDRGWYNCKVLFLDRSPEVTTNGTWYHLDVHSKPHFLQKPDDILYVSIGDSIILTCQAGGIPQPLIHWFRGRSEVIPSNHIGIFNDGTELRISNVKKSDLGSYSCVAKNSEGNLTQHTKLVQAGGAVIINPPVDQTALEQSEVVFKCEAQANPGNLSVTWFKGNLPVKSIDEGSLAERSTIKSDGSLVITSVLASDRGAYTCEVTNGIGQPISATSNLMVHFPARVSFMDTVQYIPRGLRGMINCNIEAEPPTDFVTWKKNKKIFDPFDTPGVMALKNGSLLIDKVTSDHAGDYICIPYNREGSKGPSDIIQVVIKDPPEFATRPEQEYIKDVGGKVSMPCKALGSPRPVTKWRRIDGQPLPRQRSSEHNGELTIENLRQNDHGVYECVVENSVATIVARTALLIEMTTPHAPRNITVTNSETFAVTIEWMPGYSGCAECQQTYKIRYREKDSKFPNWIELPVNPPNARKIEIHNLVANTKYEFQVMGINQYGDGMFSEIIEASTKGDGGLDFSVYPPPTASPSEQSTSADGPVGERPPPATNLTLTQEAGGYVLRWQGPPDTSKILYYTVEIKKDGQGEKWRPLTDHRIDTEEASYMMKNMGTAKAYWFRVFSHSATAYSISEKFKYDLPENVKRRAVTAGLIGGILFFIVAIILSVCTVKICNKRRRRKQERALGFVSSTHYKRSGKGRGSLVNSSCNTPPPPPPHPTSLRRGLLTLFDTVTICVQSLHERVVEEHHYQSNLKNYSYNPQESYDSDFFDYSDGRRRTQRLKSSKTKSTKYAIRQDFPTHLGHGSRAKGGYISRTKEGKFVLNESDSEGEGGFELELPPNRFRTRSVAIVAGFSPERLYSNMPPGAFVVESGVYKVGADRAWEKHEPIYWKQVVYGARTGSDGSTTIPRRVGKIVEEDLQRLRALEPSNSLLMTSPQWGGVENLDKRTLQQPHSPRLHASSPLNQRVPLIEWTSPINNYSDISSVPHPSSIERSIPSTLLTSQNFSSMVETTTSSKSQGHLQRSQRSQEIPLLRTIHEEEPRVISNVVRAEVYPTQQHPALPLRLAPEPITYYKEERKLSQDPTRGFYWNQTTYRDADTLFPNYALSLNYPAPIHGNLSPSVQYPDQPPPRFGFEELGVVPSSVYYQNPLATSSPPAPRSTRIQEAGYLDMSGLNKQNIPHSENNPRLNSGHHDYENTRYCSHAPSLYVQPETQTHSGIHSRNRKTAVIDGAIRRIKPGHNLNEGYSVPGPKQSVGRSGVSVSLVSEVLDAEVTALTNSSSPGSSSAGSRSYSARRWQADTTRTDETTLTETNSSGIASKNSSSQNRTTTSSSSGQTRQSPQDPQLPFYENWPIPARSGLVPLPGRAYHFGPPPHLLEPLPPLLPHRHYHDLADLDTSLDTPPGAIGGAGVSLSRPGSSHSAPMLDLSIDRHYEFDAARTPTDDLTSNSGLTTASMLPRTWNRPYLGYNPRTRDRELGPVAELASKERVFSDSEIYSPVFPRGRPGPLVDVSARVRAMKKEFAEYRNQQLEELQRQKMKSESESGFDLEIPLKTSPQPTTLPQMVNLNRAQSPESQDIALGTSERLESII